MDLVDVKGQTALYVAVVNGHLESTEILLEAGADPNGSRHHRSTPVYHASRVGRDDILKALIRSVAISPCFCTCIPCVFKNVLNRGLERAASLALFMLLDPPMPYTYCCVSYFDLCAYLFFY